MLMLLIISKSMHFCVSKHENAPFYMFVILPYALILCVYNKSKFSLQPFISTDCTVFTCNKSIDNEYEGHFKRNAQKAMSTG